MPDMRVAHRTAMNVMATSFLLYQISSVYSVQARQADAVETLTIRQGGLTVLLRDNSSSPAVLSGVDSLFNQVDAPDFDAFDPHERGASAGLNFEHVICGQSNSFNAFSPRHGRYQLFKLPDDHSAMLVRKAEDDPWGLSSTLKYSVTASTAIDFEFACEAQKKALFGSHGYAVLFFADYMNDVEDVALHFRGVPDARAPEQWISAGAPRGHPDYNQGGTYHSLDAPPLNYDTNHNFKLNLWSYDYPRFTRPFYYGRAAHGMTLILMFDRMYSDEDEIRFSLFKFKVPRHPRPAWDFQYVIHKVEEGRTYGFKGRLVWKKFISADDCEAEYNRWRASIEPAVFKPVKGETFRR